MSLNTHWKRAVGNHFGAPRAMLLAGVWLLLVSGSAWALTELKGQMAPDFALKSSEGSNLRLSEFRGQVVMINFWASWCGPCRDEMPFLDELYVRYREAGFAVLGVNMDEDAHTAHKMAERLGVSFPVLHDARQSVSALYDVDAMPATVMVDRDGRVRAVHRGFRDGTAERYQAEVRALLKE